VRGFKLAGVEGEVADNPLQTRQAVTQAATWRDLGVLILTDVVASEIRELVDDIRMNRELPLIVEIPGPDGPMKGRKTLREFVQEAIGVRVG